MIILSLVGISFTATAQNFDNLPKQGITKKKEVRKTIYRAFDNNNKKFEVRFQNNGVNGKTNVYLDHYVGQTISNGRGTFFYPNMAKKTLLAGNTQFNTMMLPGLAVINGVREPSVLTGHTATSKKDLGNDILEVTTIKTHKGNRNFEVTMTIQKIDQRTKRAISSRTIFTYDMKLVAR